MNTTNTKNDHEEVLHCVHNKMHQVVNKEVMHTQQRQSVAVTPAHINEL
jgi:hypothetical protein